MARIAADVAAGRVVVGGAMLDEAEHPVATMLIFDVPDREGLDAWLEADPYRLAGVWHGGEVTRFPIAVERHADRAG